MEHLLYIAGTLVILVAVSLPVYAFVRRRRVTEARRNTEADLANMMILMQTMRDMLQQQKDLARQLNESLDQKVTYIKKTVDAANKDMEVLRKSVRTVAEHLLKSKKEIAALRLEMRQARPGGETPRAVESSKPAEKGTPATNERPPNLRVLAEPAPPPAEKSLLDNWVGLDFNGDEPEPHPFDVPEIPPEEPGNADAARAAFRALLDYEEQNDTLQRDREPAPGRQEGNGRGKLTPLQARVYEYHDAGLALAEIARELGIGKGEVKLILSLRKARS